MLLLRYRALEKPSAALRDRRDSDDEADENDEGRGDDIGMVNMKGSSIRSGGGVGTGKLRGGTRRGVESDDSDFDL